MLSNIEKTTCKSCGVEIDKFQSHINKNGKKYYRKDRPRYFCSLKCSAQSKNSDSERFCLYCKKQFIIKLSQPQKYCSQQCSGLANQNCKKSKSWTYVNIKNLKKPRKPRESYKYCIQCNNKLGFYQTKELCKNCRGLNRSKKRYQEKLQQSREFKEKLIDLCGGKCQFCGYNDCTRALNFHHLDESKKSFTLDISTILKKPYWNKLLEEVKKCILLCSNCHSILHEKKRIDTRTNRRSKSRECKKDLINLMGGCCSRCKFKSEYLQCMCFHHRDPNTKIFELNTANIRKTKFKNILLEEVQKCDLLCMNCHMEIHDKLDTMEN